MEEITDYNKDKLLYGADYSSLEFNCIIKWAFDRKINLYLMLDTLQICIKDLNCIIFQKVLNLLKVENGI